MSEMQTEEMQANLENIKAEIQEEARIEAASRRAVLSKHFRGLVKAAGKYKSYSEFLRNLENINITTAKAHFYGSSMPTLQFHISLADELDIPLEDTIPPQFRTKQGQRQWEIQQGAKSFVSTGFPEEDPFDERLA